MTKPFDVAVVGAGILGLAHALAAVRRGKRVVVIDRDDKANGASIRNFGFVTITGQAAGDCWSLAKRSRVVWEEVATAAGIPVLHAGLMVTARRPQSEAVIDAFLKTEMAEGCSRMTAREAGDMIPSLNVDSITAALYSPHEVRVESTEALPKIAQWIAEVHGVEFRWNTLVQEISTPKIKTTGGVIEAETVIVCPGDEYSVLYADRLAVYDLVRSKLQMMRLRPKTGMTLPCAVMSDLGLARYHGYADLPEAAALKKCLDEEQREHRDNGVHLIVVQSADGSLVVGDSHHYARTPDPFVSRRVNQLILDEFDSVIDIGDYEVEAQWIGTYASAEDRWRLTDKPDDATRVVIVTAGCGASTAFGIGEETLSELYDG